MGEGYSIEESLNYILVRLGDYLHESDRQLPIAEYVLSDLFKKRKRIVLDISRLKRVASPLMAYIMTVVSVNPLDNATAIIDSEPDSRNINLEESLKDAHIDKYISFYKSVEEYEKRQK